MILGSRFAIAACALGPCALLVPCALFLVPFPVVFYSFILRKKPSTLGRLFNYFETYKTINLPYPECLLRFVCFLIIIALKNNCTNLYDQKNLGMRALWIIGLSQFFISIHNHSY